MPLNEDHKVYWRSHGCYFPTGHKRPCECQCGESILTDDTPFGEEKDTAVRRENTWDWYFDNDGKMRCNTCASEVWYLVGGYICSGKIECFNENE